MAQTKLFDYKDLFKKLPAGIILLDENGIVLEINKTVADWLNTRESQIIGKNIFMLRTLPKESKMTILGKFHLRQSGQDVTPYMITLRGKKDEKVTCLVSESLIADAKGNVDKIQVVLANASGLNLSQGDTEDNTNVIYQTIFDTSPVSIMIANEKEQIIQWNTFTETLLGKSKNDLYLTPVKELYPPEELDKMSALNIRKEGNVRHLDTKIYKKNGKLIDINLSISSLKDTDGITVGSIGIITDISERKSAQSKAAIADEKYQYIFENASMAIVMTDEDYTITSCNTHLTELIDQSEDALLSQNAGILYPEIEWNKIINLDITEKTRHRLETKIKHKDGKEIDVELTINFLKNSTGKVTGSIGVMHDITERKQAEESMNLMKSQFLAMVSHELSTPLTAIKGSLDIIAEGAVGEITSDQKEFLDTAQGNLERLDKQIRDLMTFQRLETGQEKFNMTEHNINLIINEATKTLSEKITEKKIELNLDLSENIPAFVCDEAKMLWAINRLINNSVSFTEKGNITVTSYEKDKSIYICIKDTGIGIKEEDVEKLFHAFSQVSQGEGRKTGGLGLGLVISSSIIQYHGGEISVESEYGKGSTFTIRLPLEAAVDPEDLK